ncbi:MAG TPA: hypothetical protein VFY16_09715 [Gemmatimonadaceae bacterium]|nr:hypothetical protein [Gemmatimonadaceae bacterium]
MITLRDLAAWEAHLARRVRQAGGTVEERDEALARHGVYADYAAVFSSYVQLAHPESEEGREALARATFLSWYAVAEASPDTGLGDLPETQVREVHERLDSAARTGGLGDELPWMLPHYHERTELAFERFPGLVALERLLEETPPDAWRAHAAEARSFHGRGLMGAYWRALAERD